MFKSSKKEDDSYTCTLSPEVQEKATKELNEDPKTRLLEVKNLRTRLEKVPGLQARTDVKFLLRFFRARKFDQERTFQLVKNYYNIRLQYADLFNDLKPSRVRRVYDDGALEILRHRDNEGCRVLIIRPEKWDVDRFSMSDLLRAIYLFLVKMSEEEDTQIHGVHLISYLSGFTLKQAAQLTPSMAKLFISTIQDVVPMRLRRYDFVKEPAFWDVIFTMLRPFMKAKLLNRHRLLDVDSALFGILRFGNFRSLQQLCGLELVLNGDKFDKLHESIKPEFLPIDLGGKLPVHDYKEFTDILLASDAQFEEDNKLGFVKMNVNSGDSVSRSGDADMQGLGGTFKKLDI